jgi:CBS domain containing-hemolysin-like protein
MVNNVILISAVGFFVVLAGIFAGSETGMYQFSRLRLRLGIEKKRLPFIILGRCLSDSPGLLLSMLIGTNLAHYLATSIVTSMFLGKVNTEQAAEFFATALTVPILFIFSELIPKNMFFYRADLLMPYFSPLLYSFHKFLSWCGIVPALKFVSGGFARLLGLAASSRTFIATAQRHKVQAILQDTHEEGILSPVQSDIINRLVGISHVHIGSVMIPMQNVETVDVNSDDSALLNKLNKCAFTRLPVTEGRTGNIIGFISIYEALSSSEKFADLSGFVKPIRKLDADTAVIDAMNIMQKENQKIILVVRAGRFGRQRPVGIVTMKDLVEELLGELAEW